MPIKITFLGAARSVTGSRYLIETNRLKFMVDCGLHQERELKDRDWGPFPVPPDTIEAILLTHAHWDHASGLTDFPGVPVLVTAEERSFIADGGWLTAIARSATDARYQPYAFEGGPYLGFARSHDLYGDGAIVVVPAPGHTPGSVIVFVALPDGRRYAFVGDLAWQREGILEREERPWLVRREADRDPAQVRAALLQMAAIAARFPAIALVPAHDARAFRDLPRL